MNESIKGVLQGYTGCTKPCKGVLEYRVYKGLQGVLEYTGYKGYTGCTRVYRVFKGIHAIR